MKLSELIAHVGDDNVQIQNLQRDLVSVETMKREGRIAFATDKAKTLILAGCSVSGDKPTYVGLVIWIPRERLPNELA